MKISCSVAVVTGGGAGLGRAVAVELAKNGAAVAINYRQSEQEADETADLVRKVGGTARTYRADVADWEAVATMVRKVEAEIGPVGSLINNAGLTLYAREPTEISRADWDRILAVNLSGAFGCIRAVLPFMRRRGDGCIVNVASIAGMTGQGSSLPYVLSKASLLTMTRALARDVRPIRINAIAPGFMPTNWFDRYYPAEARPTGSEMTPLTNVVDGILTLIRNDALNGAVLVIDKGQSLRTGFPAQTYV